MYYIFKVVFIVFIGGVFFDDIIVVNLQRGCCFVFGYFDNMIVFVSYFGEVVFNRNGYLRFYVVRYKYGVINLNEENR